MDSIVPEILGTGAKAPAQRDGSWSFEQVKQLFRQNPVGAFETEHMVFVIRAVYKRLVSPDFGTISADDIYQEYVNYYGPDLLLNTQIQQCIRWMLPSSFRGHLQIQLAQIEKYHAQCFPQDDFLWKFPMLGIHGEARGEGSVDEEEKERIPRTFDYVYKGYATDARDALRLRQVYLSSHDEHDAFEEGPAYLRDSSETQRERIGRLMKAILNIKGTKEEMKQVSGAQEATDPDVKLPKTSWKRFSDWEIELVCWLLYVHTCEAQQGRCTLPHYFKHKGPLYDKFDSFELRFDAVVEELTLDKDLCNNCFQSDLWISRIAWCLSTETKRKVQNAKINSTRDQQVQVAKYVMRRGDVKATKDGQILDATTEKIVAEPVTKYLSPHVAKGLATQFTRKRKGERADYMEKANIKFPSINKDVVEVEADKDTEPPNKRTQVWCTHQREQNRPADGTPGEADGAVSAPLARSTRPSMSGKNAEPKKATGEPVQKPLRTRTFRAVRGKAAKGQLNALPATAENSENNALTRNIKSPLTNTVADPFEPSTTDFWYTSAQHDTSMLGHDMSMQGLQHKPHHHFPLQHGFPQNRNYPDPQQSNGLWSTPKQPETHLQQSTLYTTTPFGDHSDIEAARERAKQKEHVVDLNPGLRDAGPDASNLAKSGSTTAASMTGSSSYFNGPHDQSSFPPLQAFPPYDDDFNDLFSPEFFIPQQFLDMPPLPDFL
ncbi:hypothetical protein BJ170DRAFT_591781 [Xylariales sp. AK1849]|nr:hypothetical protein BJ170DRAFT_591781 [Xylariales sp. AK1849]